MSGPLGGWSTFATNSPPVTAAQIREAIRKLDAIRNPHRDLMLVASDRLEELGDAAMAKALREAAGEK